MNKIKDGVIEKIRKNKPKWFNLQNFVFVVVILAFIVIVLWSESLSIYFQGTSEGTGVIVFTPTTLFGTPTPLPEEYLSSAQQTNGIVSGALIILVAILAGTAAILIRDREK